MLDGNSILNVLDMLDVLDGDGALGMFDVLDEFGLLGCSTCLAGSTAYGSNGFDRQRVRQVRRVPPQRPVFSISLFGLFARLFSRA